KFSLRSVPTHKLPCTHGLLSFRLYLNQFQYCCGAAAHQQSVAGDPHFARSERKYVRRWLRVNDLQVLSSERGISSGPGLKAAQTIVNFSRGQAEVNQPIFFFQDRRQSRARVVLDNRNNTLALQAA